MDIPLLSNLFFFRLTEENLPCSFSGLAAV